MMVPVYLYDGIDVLWSAPCWGDADAGSVVQFGMSGDIFFPSEAVGQ